MMNRDASIALHERFPARIRLVHLKAGGSYAKRRQHAFGCSNQRVYDSRSFTGWEHFGHAQDVKERLWLAQVYLYTPQGPTCRVLRDKPPAVDVTGPVPEGPRLLSRRLVQGLNRGQVVVAAQANGHDRLSHFCLNMVLSWAFVIPPTCATHRARAFKPFSMLSRSELSTGVLTRLWNATTSLLDSSRYSTGNGWSQLYGPPAITLFSRRYHITHLPRGDQATPWYLCERYHHRRWLLSDTESVRRYLSG